MKSTQYSEKVLDHFRNPRNVGTLEGDDVAVGKVGNPVCGDLMEFYIKVKEDKIQDIRFKTFGCGSAIATASMITELAKGKSLEDALKITRQDVADELDGLPPIKMHCSNLAADALRDAIKNYREKRSKPHINATTERKQGEIIGETQFLGKGVFHAVDDPTRLRDKRVIVIHRGTESTELAVELIHYTPRVIFVTSSKEQSIATDEKTRLQQSHVKVLYESEIIEVKGVRTVEKVLIHDLNENEQYELFVDAVVLLQ